MRNAEKIQLTIESIAFEGKGIAHHNGKVVFVRNAIPGDIVEAEITKHKKNYTEARIVHVITPSPKRIVPKCEYFGTCGGCSFQNLDYEEQIRWKRNFVIDAFERIGKVKTPVAHPTLPATNILHYRNKTEFTFGTSRWLTEEEIASGTEISQKHFALGFHIPERFDKVLDLTHCLLHPEKANRVLQLIRQEVLERKLPAYNLRTHKGFLRNLVFRFSRSNNEMMVLLITTSPSSQAEQGFVEWLSDGELITNSDINHLVYAANDSFSPILTGSTTTLKGNGFLVENLAGIRFKISPFSFFQVNIEQAEKVVAKVVEYSKGNSKIIWDLYCGAGTMTLPLAKQSEFVFGLEVSESSVEDAKENANINGFRNVVFYTKDLHSKTIVDELRKLEPPDLVVLDPPRSGIHKNLVAALIGILPRRIIYISCNPATQARDFSFLSNFYNLVEVQPVDMFPQTYHVESIAVLELK
jgi:23S rRNA (uracil1939-C5)-methyltransferase